MVGVLACDRRQGNAWDQVPQDTGGPLLLLCLRSAWNRGWAEGCVPKDKSGCCQSPG